MACSPSSTHTSPMMVWRSHVRAFARPVLTARPCTSSRRRGMRPARCDRRISLGLCSRSDQDQADFSMIDAAISELGISQQSSNTQSQLSRPSVIFETPGVMLHPPRQGRDGSTPLPKFGRKNTTIVLRAISIGTACSQCFQRSRHSSAIRFAAINQTLDRCPAQTPGQAYPDLPPCPGLPWCSVQLRFHHGRVRGLDIH